MTQTTPKTYTTSQRRAYQFVRYRIAQLAAAQRADKRKKIRNLERAMELTALHSVLNEFRGKPCAHTYRTKSYLCEWVRTYVAQIVDDAQSGAFDGPLKTYVLVSDWSHASKTRLAPSVSQLHVQAAHALAQLVDTYHDHPLVRQWLDVDKTLVVCRLQYLRRVSCGKFISWPTESFYDSYYDATMAMALLPCTDVQAKRMGLSEQPLL